ncbi:hypothetical protein [Natrinema marinum]|uniref:hypothetical protein n=1 Tax=Natrinema marinum TaxID=2961598 RepID=UPI0020C8D1AC|nr:hypothetical protein [Natrinema marinum]
MAPAPDGSPPPTDGSDDDRPHSFSWHADRVVDRFGELRILALVPLLVTVLNVEAVRRTVGSAGRGFTVGVKFLFPAPLSSLWTFTDPPAPAVPFRDERRIGDSTVGAVQPETTPRRRSGFGTDVTIQTPIENVELPLEAIGVELGARIGLLVVAYAVISGILMAAYVGGIDRLLRGNPVSVPACVTTYAPRFVLYNLVAFAGFLLLIPAVAMGPVGLVLAFPALLLVGYLFYPVPFLFVVSDAPFLEAFRRAVRLTGAGGPPLRFALWHLAAGVAVSLVLSLLVNLGVPGFLFALGISAPVALLLTATTVSFFQEYDGDERFSDDEPSSSGREPFETDEDGWAAN